MMAMLLGEHRSVSCSRYRMHTIALRTMHFTPHQPQEKNCHDGEATTESDRYYERAARA